VALRLTSCPGSCHASIFHQDPCLPTPGSMPIIPCIYTIGCFPLEESLCSARWTAHGAESLQGARKSRIGGRFCNDGCVCLCVCVVPMCVCVCIIDHCCLAPHDLPCIGRVLQSMIAHPISTFNDTLKSGKRCSSVLYRLPSHNRITTEYFISQTPG
jgi:hypothetical protein